MWRTVRELATAATCGSENTDPFTSRRGAGRQAALQEKRHFAVAAVGPQGTASAQWSLFARRQWVVSIVLSSPGFEAPARFVGKYRTRKNGEKPEISPQGRSIDRLGGSMSPAELL